MSPAPIPTPKPPAELAAAFAAAFAGILRALVAALFGDIATLSPGTLRWKLYSRLLADIAALEANLAQALLFEGVAVSPCGAAPRARRCRAAHATSRPHEMRLVSIPSAADQPPAAPGASDISASRATRSRPVPHRYVPRVRRFAARALAVQPGLPRARPPPDRQVVKRRGCRAR
ncbi:MAG: hypothetical protein NT133_14885 [Alphaproteobacteria bacterium]|nr:hypothetical protein [Alphaproteobacteria bacterium]